MKTKVLLFVLCSFLFSSCGTLFTRTKQPITFIGIPKTAIYDNGKKIGVIGEDGETVIKVRKKLSDKILVAKRKGYKNTYIELDAVFNPVSIINFTNIFAWVIDLASEKCCKWDNDIVEIEMEAVWE
ncbi:MAG: hypothetical protein IIW77_05075 [Bacteroidaceae bacterium]|nr:hypothetical protein [Bacteroidaceae bacterium]